ncbi:class II aldolase/adducin family protein [Polynucleobacter meluiroseus]|nr:class II aldolase/adducin family protein [Polynucleobacter meluiroseus]
MTGITLTLLKDLAQLSATIGNNAMLSQGAGGNTSIKIDSTLWVKASGFWLQNASIEDIFVPLELKAVRRLIDSGSDYGIQYSVVDKRITSRPSIEATLHALLPQKVILHCHSIRALSFAVRTDSNFVLGERLKGLNWATVPYCRPGMPLTLAVKKVLCEKLPNVLILENHGLVVAAENCQAVQALLNEVETRLNRPKRTCISPDINLLLAIAAGSNYRLPIHEICHSLATSPISSEIVEGGSLYPDQVVFLGVNVTAVSRDEIFNYLSGAYKLAPFILIRGMGVLVKKDISPNAEEMIHALALVCIHIENKDGLKYLSATEEKELLGWEAEQYRISLQLNK